MTINDAGQEVVGGIPESNLTAADIVQYHGAIVGSNSEGDLFVWEPDSNSVGIFSQNQSGDYDHTDTIEEDLEGRDLEYVMEWVSFNLAV